MVRVYIPDMLLRVYTSISKVIHGYQQRIRETYGASHMGKCCGSTVYAYAFQP